MKNTKVLFIIPYPLQQAPSQRFRFEQYFNSLSNAGYSYKIHSFLDSKDWKIFYAEGHVFKKFTILIFGFLKRIVALFTLARFEYVFIHREASPIGPPLFEWVIFKILRKKIIYDFDDAIWMTDKKQEGSIEQTIRWRSKVASICRWSYKVSCGNEYLAMYARQFNSRVVVNPTTIDTEYVHNPSHYKGILRSTQNDGKLVIGWTGSHSTLKYLKTIEPVLQRLEAKHERIHFLVIADRKPDLSLKRLDFIPWDKESEAADLQKMDIGIMPLPDDEWAKGKCGFKALQYMAMEIPCVASPVGVNITIVENGVNGFLADTDEEWLQQLEKLIIDKSLRQTMGKVGRKKAVEWYSVESNTENFLQLFS